MFPSIELSLRILTRLIERLNQLSGLSTPLSNSPVISANFFIKFLNAINTGLCCGESKRHFIEELFLI